MYPDPDPLSSFYPITNLWLIELLLPPWAPRGYSQHASQMCLLKHKLQPILPLLEWSSSLFLIYVKAKNLAIILTTCEAWLWTILVTQTDPEDPSAPRHTCSLRSCTSSSPCMEATPATPHSTELAPSPSSSFYLSATLCHCSWSPY